MTLLTRADLVAASKRRYKIIALPVNGGSVRIQSLFNSEMRRVRQLMVNTKGDVNPKVYAKYNELVIANSLVDEDGERIFSDEDALGTAFDFLDGADVAVMLAAVKKHTGIGADEDFQAIESAVKNSGSTAGNSDCGESPSGSDSVACMSS